MATVGITPEETEEINKIRQHLEPEEKVLLVARQSRIAPGGAITTPMIIFATDRKLVIRNPMLLGARESVQLIPYAEITAIDLEKGVFSSEIKVAAPGLTMALNRFFKTTRQGIAGIPAIPKDKGEKIVSIVKEGMKREKAARAMPQGAPASTPLDELRKLKELLDLGAITKEEYEEKKKTILGKL
jgi:hypothetical protein